MFVVLVFGFLGSIVSLVGLLPYGWLVALLSAPLGGSLAGLFAACLLANLRALSGRSGGHHFGFGLTENRATAQARRMKAGTRGNFNRKSNPA
jgi:hypothetical protein